MKDCSKKLISDQPSSSSYYVPTSRQFSENGTFSFILPRLQNSAELRLRMQYRNAHLKTKLKKSCEIQHFS